MPGVTKEQIAQAKEWDLLSYLQTYEPHELKRYGPHEYCTRPHDSLKISNGKWCWNSRGIGGRTALDYLIKVRGWILWARRRLCAATAPAAPGAAKAKTSEALFASMVRHIRPDFLFPVFLSDLLDFPLKIEYLRNPKFATFFARKVPIWARSSAGRALRSHP